VPLIDLFEEHGHNLATADHAASALNLDRLDGCVNGHQL
jgi:hypothetical protein